MLKLTPSGFLSENQRQQLEEFPETIDQENLIQYFMLSDTDLKIIPIRSPPYSRLGFAVSLCALRFLGFIPEVLEPLPKAVMSFLMKQLNLDGTLINLAQYGTRAQTKTDHALVVENYLGFKRFTEEYRAILQDWLLRCAMEHDRPTLLLNNVIEKLKRDKIVRPALSNLERLVCSVRDKAWHKTYQQLLPILSEQRKALLNEILIIDKPKGKTLLAWLRQCATSHSPESICMTLEKIAFLEQAGVGEWDLSFLNTNRLKTLNRLGKCSTNQALQRSSPEKRYSI